MSNPIDVIVGRNVRDRRVRAGITQEDLGAAVGITFQQIQKYERALNRISASRLIELSRALKVPVTDLFEGVGEEITVIEKRTEKDLQREQKVVDEFNRLPDDVKDSLSVLVQAMARSIGGAHTGAR